jgi:hypothetical protein
MLFFNYIIKGDFIVKKEVKKFLTVISRNRPEKLLSDF